MPAIGGNPHSHHSLISSIVGKALGVPAHFGTHLANDVKDAVTGLPAGIVTIATQNPIKSVKEIGRATWQDWAPLVEGHPNKWLKQTYAHPLAPLLDVATVFSLGAGAAAKGGQFAIDAGLAEEGSTAGRTLKAVADLGKARVRVVHDTHGAARGVERVPRKKVYSANAGANLRRAAASKALLQLEPHLPAFFKQSAREGRLYDRLQHVDDAHRLFAQGVQTVGLLKAGALMTDPAAQKIIQPAIKEHVARELNQFAHVKPAAPGEDVLAPGEVYLLRDPKLAYNPKEGLDQWMDHAGRYLTTRDPAKALLGDGGYKVVRTDAVKAYTREGADSARFLRQLPAKATTWWKRINVGYAPRTITNNAVGNWFMFAMRTAGHGGARSLIDALRYTRGERAAMKAFKSMHAHIVDTQGVEQGAKFLTMAHPDLIAEPNIGAIERVFGKKAVEAVKRPPNWIDKFFKNEIGNTYGHALGMAESGAGAGVKGKAAGAVRSGVYPFVHRVADQPVRVASLYNFVRRAPEVRSYLKTHPGVSVDEAAMRVLEKDVNSIRERAVQHVRSIAGDYVTRGPFEKLVQSIIPFYLWDKHIFQHVGAMAAEQPGRLALTQQVSHLGNDEIQKFLGQLPDYLANVLPLEMLGIHGSGGRVPVMTTQGLNPYASIGDIAQTIAAFTTGEGNQQGEAAASDLSPLLTGLAEQITGNRIGSEAPVDRHGGVIPSVVANTANQLGYAQLIQRLLNGGSSVTSKGTPTLYKHSADESLTSLFGIPLRHLSKTTAAGLAAKQGKKRKHRTVNVL
jgi:hypothetical protein